jgi:hypothetical protein
MLVDLHLGLRKGKCGVAAAAQPECLDLLAEAPWPLLAHGKDLTRRTYEE